MFPDRRWIAYNTAEDDFIEPESALSGGEMSALPSDDGGTVFIGPTRVLYQDYFSNFRVFFAKKAVFLGH